MECLVKKLLEYDVRNVRETTENRRYEWTSNICVENVEFYYGGYGCSKSNQPIKKL